MYDIYGNAKVTGNFGERRSYYRPGKFHEGDDIALAMNSPINARLGGKVLNIQNDPSGYGNYVDIDHGNGVVTRYAHANSFNVKPGQLVKEGDQIGLVGSTGRSSGPHLHTELIINGVKKNPRELEKYMANLMNIPQPKENPKKPDIRGAEGLMNDIANQYIDEQKAAKQKEQDEFRTSVNDFIKSKLLPIEVPKYTELKDVLSAEKGDKLGVFADFLKNPQTIRTIGNLFGGTYMDRNGNFVHGLERQALKEEDLMKQAQQEALEEARLQSGLVGNVYNAFNQKDLADLADLRARDLANLADTRARDLAQAQRDFQREENALSREQNQQRMNLEEKRLDALIKHNQAIEDIEREKIGATTGGAANLNKMSATERKQYTENKTTLANIESGLKALEENPNAYQWYKGLLGADITNRIDPKGVGTRTQIDNITAVYRKWLTGAQMSDRERKAYERFLPAPTDNYQIVKAKLEGMRDAVQRSNDALLGSYGISETKDNDPLGLGL